MWSTGRMTLTGEHWGAWIKPVPVPLFSPQIPHELAWDWTRSSTVRVRQQTFRALTQPERVSDMYLEKYPSQCHCFHHKSHMNWLGTEPGPTRSESVNKPSEPWHGPRESLMWLTSWLHKARAFFSSAAYQQTLRATAVFPFWHEGIR